MKQSTTHTPTALDEAKKLPPPTAGLSLGALPISVAVEYLKLHDLEIVTAQGGTTLIVRRKPSNSPLGIAQQLAKIGE